MGSTSIKFREEIIELHEVSLAIWLRLMAMNLETVSCKGSIIELRNDWMSASAAIKLIVPNLERIDSDIQDAEVVLKVAARLVHQINNAGRRFRGDFLNLLGLGFVSWTNDDEIDASHVLTVADKFVGLICRHGDILQRIVQRNTDPPRERKGPPCRYCGVRLWHPEGQQCLECGWDWHDIENPVKRRGGAGRKPPPPIACLEDGGNPFDERGFLRRVEQDAAP